MSEIQKFKYMLNGLDVEIRVVEIDGAPWWIASDVCKVLDLPNVGMAIGRLHGDDVSSADVILPYGSSGASRKQVVKIVNESGLYDLILDSRKPEAKRFRRWVTAEVLPTIRKTGGYLDPRQVDITDPAQLAAIFRASLDAAEKLEAANAKIGVLENTIEKQAPDVLVAEEFFDTDGLMGLRETARSFTIPQTEFMALLREWDWIDKYGTAAKAWTVKQGLLENKVFLLRGGGQRVYSKVTRKGIRRIAEKLREPAA